MHSLDIIFKEEYERQKALLEEYRQKLADLPKGSIAHKKISGKEYVYLKFWKDGKRISQYIGKEGSEKHIEYRKKIDARLNLSKKVKRASELIKKMEKGYRATD